MAKPVFRDGTYYLRRRVPKRFAEIEPRAVIWASLKTDSLREAEDKLESVWDSLVGAWEARLAGDTAAAEEELGHARKIAHSRGFRYLPSSRVARLPLEDLLQRIESIPKINGSHDIVVAKAVLGAVQPPEITLSRARDIFIEVTQDRRAGMTRDQERIWLNARRRAVETMIDAIGDLPMQQIGADELLDYREALWGKVQAGEITAATANKAMTFAFHTIKTVNSVRRLGLSFDFSDLRFRGAAHGTRRPFSDEWIRDRILAPGALAGLNTEARCVLLGMVNTGYRPSEATGLRPEDIRLDTDIPHISIHGRFRRIKNRESERDIPLVGVSLEAFRQCPGGFPRYRDRGTVTAAINKFMRENGLRETPEHSLYGLRHSFEDRLLGVGVDERIRRDLLGHRLANRERYGAGARLAQLHEILLGIAL
jgi:integrase